MIQKNKILLLFPDGVGIRNYLYSEVFKGLEDNLVWFHAFDDDTIHEIQKITNINEAVRVPKYKESITEKFYRELICFSRLKHNATLVKNPTLLNNWKTNHSSFKSKLFYKIIERFAKTVKTYQQILNLEKRYQKAVRRNKFYTEVQSILEEIKPTQIFCSHQRGLQCAPIFAVASDLGIKTTTVIYSWDNLPKARLALKANQYLIWSKYMKEEMQLYYPEIDAEKIIVTGTPQFECYKNPQNRIAKQEFYKRYDLDINKKIICFSGDDVKTSPDDPKYLDDLASELINSGLSDEFQILFRRCPVDISGRFAEVISKNKGLIKEAPPLWNFQPSTAWTTIYPLPEDVALLVSTAYYCDVVVNVGSTMAFDFAMFNKPCIYINYDQEIQVNPNWSVEKIYKFQHFRSMPNKDCVIWWNAKKDLSSIVSNLTFNEKMKDWMTVVLSDYNTASTQINKILK